MARHAKNRVGKDELKVRSEIFHAFGFETARIDVEIKRLREDRKELKKLLRRVLVLGRRAYALMNKKGEVAAKQFRQAENEARLIIERVVDLRGACEPWRELNYRHVDLWVVLDLDKSR